MMNFIRPKKDADFITDLPLNEAVIRLKGILSEGTFGNLRKFKRIAGNVSEKKVKLKLYIGKFPPFIPTTGIYFEGAWEKAGTNLTLRGSFKLSDIYLPFIVFWELGIIWLVISKALIDIFNRGINESRIVLLALGVVFAIGGAVAPYFTFNYLSDAEIEGITESVENALKSTNSS